jgi:hypothetical protein
MKNIQMSGTLLICTVVEIRSSLVELDT